MPIRIRFGRSSANGGTERSPLLPFGLFVTAWGLLLAWIAHEKGDTALMAPGLVVAASGAWIAGLHRLVRNRATGLAVMGGLFVGWSVVGGTAAVLHRFWIGAFMCSALLVTGLLLLGMLPLPTWAQRALAAVRKIGFGLAFMGVGLVITAVGLAGGASEGVPPFVPVAAGLVFFLGGVLAVLHQSGREDTLLSRTLAALVATGLASTAVVFPPALLLSSPIVVLFWIAVVRLAIQKRTGSDPLGRWSDERVLGLGCGVTVLIWILILGLFQVRSCVQKPEARPPAEAVDLGS